MRSAGSDTSKNKVPKDLHFGDLIEKSFGMNSFDLKREMEILRKVDEEVKSVKFKQRHEPEEFSVHIVEDEEEEVKAEKSIVEVSASNTEVVVKPMSKSQKMEVEYQKLKALVTIPYLPPLRLLEDLPVYTLVLDLDETLIHLECDEDADKDGDDQNEDSIYYLIRPGAIRFINELSKYFEIVIFTAAMPDVIFD